MWKHTLSLLCLAACSAGAQSLTTQMVVDQITRPIWAASPRGDSNRLFFLTQFRPITNFGRLSIVDLRTNRVLSPAYLETPAVARTSIEQGALGFAFHPNFMSNGYLYVVYNAVPEPGVSAGTTTLVRYRATGGDPNANTADPASAYVLLRIRKPDPTHNGGWIGFGSDGYLYMSTGDGGNGDDTNGGATIDPPGHTPVTGNAQDLTNNLMGKILRLDVNGPDGVPGTADDDGFPNDPDKNYCIPPGNPFIGIGDGEIFHYGMRNPWRCNFDRETGDLWVGDVGQATREEVDRIPAGASGKNLGWRCREGTLCTGLTGCSCDDASLLYPVYEYPHTESRCAINGGAVYRGCAMPWLRGTYFFADYCTSQIWSFRMSGSTVVEFTERTAELDPPGPRSILNPVAFCEDNSGELYICDIAGAIFKIVPTVQGADCNANGLPDSCDIAEGRSRDSNANGIPDECEPPCPADFNGDGGVDGSDVEAFYIAWEASMPRADVNQDGGIDGADVESFFLYWEAGGC